MNLSKLPKTTTKSTKRLGRGYGSGKGGHTSTRGQKGQKSRSKVPIWFEGGQLPQIRRFPFIRGKSRLKSLKPNLIEINLSQLKSFRSGSIVDHKSLLKAGLLKNSELKKSTVKILGRGKIDKPLKINIHTSLKAAEKIKKAGGTVKP